MSISYYFRNVADSLLNLGKLYNNIYLASIVYRIRVNACQVPVTFSMTIKSGWYNFEFHCMSVEPTF